MIVLFLVLTTGSCKKDEKKEDVQPTPTAEPADIPVPQPAQPVELTGTPDDSSQKWLEMLGTDMENLQVGDAATSAAAIHVVSFHPQGQTRKIDEVDEVNITFSEPVAPLQKIEKGAPSLIDITPYIKGEGFWKSSTTYCYRMDEKLKLSSRYNITFKGYQAFSGKTIAPKTWDFSTPTITIVRTQPYHKNKWQTLEQKVLVQFSQDVEPDKLKNYIKISSDKGEHYFNIRYCNDEERKLLYYWRKDKKDTEKYVTITPKANYPIATDINVLFLKDLPSKEGNIGLQKPRIMNFRTYEIFSVLSVEEKFLPDAGIEVTLSNPAPISKFLEQITFEPEVEIKKEGDWNSSRFYIHGKFKPGTTYTMTVPASVKDRFGNTLGQERKFTSICQDFSPYLYPPGPQHFVLESYLEKSIPINVRNIFSTNVYYKEITPTDLKRILKSGYLPSEMVNHKTCNKYLWQIPIKKNRDYTVPFKLKDIGIKNPGFYYIYFENASRDYYQGHIFQLTDIAIVAKYSPTQIFLMPFQMKNGEPVPKTKFNILDFNAPPLESGKNGVAQFDPPASIFGKNAIQRSLIFSSPKKAFIWGGKYEMFDMWSYSYNSDMNYNYSAKYYYNYVLAFTDKHLYKAGQTVKFKGILRQILGGEMKTPDLKNVDIRVYNSRNQKIHQFDIKGAVFTRFGTFAGDFVLPEDAPTGFYRIEFKGQLAQSKFSKTLTFSVEEYKPAKFEVKVSFDKKKLVAGDDFSGIVNARYLFGTPMMKAEGNCVWTIQNTYYQPKGWDRYIFGVSESHIRKTIFNKTFKLDDEGNYKFEQDDFNFDCKNSVNLTVHGEVKDKDNNRIASSKSIIAHRGLYYIGLKTGSYFFKQGKPGKIFLATITPEGQVYRDSDTELKLKITREEWKSFQQKDASGSLRWEWKKLTEDILSEKIDIPGGEFEKEYTFKRGSIFAIKVDCDEK